MEKGLSIKAFLLHEENHKEVRRFAIPASYRTNFLFIKSKVQNIFGLAQEFSLSWQDEEGDMVTICSDEELIEAIDECITQGHQKLFKIFVKLICSSDKADLKKKSTTHLNNEEPSSTHTESHPCLMSESLASCTTIKEEKDISSLQSFELHNPKPSVSTFYKEEFSSDAVSAHQPDMSNTVGDDYSCMRIKLSRCLENLDENQNAITSSKEATKDASPINEQDSQLFELEGDSFRDEYKFEVSEKFLQAENGDNLIKSQEHVSINPANQDSWTVGDNLSDDAPIVALDSIPDEIQEEIQQLEAGFQGELFVKEGLIDQTATEKDEKDSDQDLATAASFLLGEHPLMPPSQSIDDPTNNEIMAQIQPILNMTGNKKIVERSNICPECQMSCQDKEEFITHWILSHLVTKPYKCLECNYRSYQVKLIENHMYSHYKVKRFRCKVCSFKTSKEEQLREHLLSHDDLKPFKCDQCEAEFPQKRGLTIHMFVHTGEKPFKCSECSSAFVLKEHLKKHMLTHTGIKPFKCVWCSRMFAHKFSLKFHMYRHLKLKPYKCAECDMQFTQKGHLNSHMLTHSPVKPFKCTECDAAFSRKETMKRHILTHSKTKEYKCSICPAEFTFKSSFNRHMFNHSNPKSHICIICNTNFNSRNELKTHMLTHRGTKPFRCDPCNVEFTQKGSLKRHLLKHGKTKTFSCPSCPMVFKQKGFYDRHIQTHAEPKKYICDKCNLEFKSKEYLRRHSITHMDTKPHKCTQCSAEFNQKWSLKRHMIVHTGIKPFKCAECNKAYAQRQQLKEHMLIHMQFDD